MSDRPQAHAAKITHTAASGVSFSYVGPVELGSWVFGYSQHGFSILGMGLNFITDYPVGLWRKLPMKWHQMVELTSPPITIGVPWVFFHDAGAFPWVASVLGVAILISTLLTRPVKA